MPIIKSAIKRMRQTLKRRARNVSSKRDMRVALKSFAGDKTAQTLAKAQSEIDKAVKKNIMNKNTAARKKAQLAKAAKEAGAKATSAKKAAAKTTAAKPAAKKTTETKKAAAAKKPVAKKAPAKKAEKKA